MLKIAVLYEPSDNTSVALDPNRVRRIRGGFSWIDRRFVRDGWLERLANEFTFYFFLVAVAILRSGHYACGPCGQSIYYPLEVSESRSRPRRKATKKKRATTKSPTYGGLARPSGRAPEHRSSNPPHPFPTSSKPRFSTRVMKMP